MPASRNMTIERVGNVAKNILAICVLASFVVGIGWKNYAQPSVDKMICAKTDPLRDAIEFQNYLMMETMPDSAVEDAIRKYTQMKSTLKGVLP